MLVEQSVHPYVNHVPFVTTSPFENARKPLAPPVLRWYPVLARFFDDRKKNTRKLKAANSQCNIPICILIEKVRRILAEVSNYMTKNLTFSFHRN